MKVVEKWCDDYGLKVNPVKTELVMFTNKRALGDYRLPKLFNTTLRLSNEVKYLGITLDSKLNWGSHIDKTTTKTNIIFWQCRKMISKTWGLSPLIVRWLYTTIIRPIISYAAVVWWTKTNQVTTINKLRRLQRRACCAITGCMKTTPTSALETILDVRPLHLFIQQEAACTATRLSMLGLWRDNSSPHTSILADIYRYFPYFAAVNDLIPKTYVFDKKYKIQLYEDTPDHCLQKELRVYTDGSKTNYGTGSGVFSEDLNIHISTALGAYNTVFQAECVGIIKAAEAIDCRKVRGKHIRILSDSASVLQALDNNIMTSGLIYECHCKLTNIANDNRLTLQWIKGHSGSRGPKSVAFCCEDHFDVENDMDNYVKFKLVGGKLKLKKGVLPHKFACQNRLVENPERPVMENLRLPKLKIKISADYVPASQDLELYIVDDIKIEEPVEMDPLEVSRLKLLPQKTFETKNATLRLTCPKDYCLRNVGFLMPHATVDL
ncbi:hypothetical protein evm_008668 [Chilo suppressalis]|nr:hypothetical protein evm_008668 [Chilo suppressalis]